jgi:hypothetical protein
MPASDKLFFWLFQSQPDRALPPRQEALAEALLAFRRPDALTAWPAEG